MWDELLEIMKDNKDSKNKDPEDIENDFVLNFKMFFHKLHQFCDEIKVPKRLKSNPYESILHRAF